MKAVDWADVRDSFLREAARAPHEKAVYSKDTRWNALRKFYKLADKEIREAGQNQWGIDPYEIDWLRVFTPIEQALWHDIRGANLVMYPQYPVLNFFVDFGNPVAKVAIECDGAAWHQDKDKDARRDEKLRLEGWFVYRISGKNCLTDFNEETMIKGAARRFIDEIAEFHSLGKFAGANV